MKPVLSYIFFICFTVTCFITFTVVFLLTVAFDRERVVLHYASIFWSRIIYRLCFWSKVKVSGQENIKRGEPYVVITNHQSVFDIPLMYEVPLCFKWVAKEEVYRWPVFGWVLRMHGDIAIKRGTASGARLMIAEGCRHLAVGTSIMMFPEGTRSRDGRVHRFHEGAFAMAKAAGVAVLPCAAEGTGNAMDSWRVRIPHEFRVEIMEPIPASTVAAMSARDLADMAYDMVLNRHELLRPDLYDKAA